MGKLFVQLTCQLWMQIDEAWLIDPEHRPEPTSLQDAIKAWSLNEMFKNVRSCGFKACNANIPGSAGAGCRQASFSERMNTFFPDADEDSKPANRSPWSIFWTKPGYVWEYHELLKNCAPSEGFDIRKQLGKLFLLVETLPDSVKGSLKTPGKTWRLEEDKVVLITNPKLYKIKGICKENERKQG